LLDPSKFVDRQKNFIDPPSNEFLLQPADLALYFLTQTDQSGGKNAIFAVLRGLEPDAGGGEDIADPRALLVGDRQTLGEVGAARLDRGLLLLAFLPPQGRASKGDRYDCPGAGVLELGRVDGGSEPMRRRRLDGQVPASCLECGARPLGEVRCVFPNIFCRCCARTPARPKSSRTG
jgi:hypothetical protein